MARCRNCNKIIEQVPVALTVPVVLGMASKGDVWRTSKTQDLWCPDSPEGHEPLTAAEYASLRGEDLPPNEASVVVWNQDAIQLEAASRLEDLAVVMKEMVSRIRMGTETDPYAATYWLRRELGYVVAKLGAGQPSISEVAEYYTQQIQKR